MVKFVYDPIKGAEHIQSANIVACHYLPPRGVKQKQKPNRAQIQSSKHAPSSAGQS